MNFSELYNNISILFSIDSTLSPFAIYTSLFFSLFLNGLINIPSSQIIYLTLGYLVNRSDFDIYIAILAGSLGNTLGNLILYYIIKSKNVYLNQKIRSFFNISEDKLEKYNKIINQKGYLWLIIGKLTPSVKVLVPIICGISNLSFIKTFIIFFTGSVLWACMVTYLGYYFGKMASLKEFYIIVSLIYILIGLSLYLFAKFRKKYNNITTNK